MRIIFKNSPTELKILERQFVISFRMTMDDSAKGNTFICPFFKNSIDPFGVRAVNAVGVSPIGIKIESTNHVPGSAEDSTLFGRESTDGLVHLPEHRKGHHKSAK